MANTKTANIDDLSTVAGCLLGVVGLLAAIPVYIYEAWAITVLWGWFVVPTWGGPELPILTVMGLLYLRGLVWPRYGIKADTAAEESKSPGRKIVETLTVGVLGTSFCLGSGWLIHVIQGSPLQ